MPNASKTVQVVAGAGMITIRCGDAMISEHPQAFLKSPGSAGKDRGTVCPLLAGIETGDLPDRVAGVVPVAV